MVGSALGVGRCPFTRLRGGGGHEAGDRRHGRQPGVGAARRRGAGAAGAPGTRSERHRDEEPAGERPRVGHLPVRWRRDPGVLWRTAPGYLVLATTDGSSLEVAGSGADVWRYLADWISEEELTAD